MSQPRGIPLTKAHRELIAREMGRRGHTQASLADVCKTSQPTIQRILRGEQSPSWVMLTAICGALRLGFTWEPRRKLKLYREE